MSFFDDLLATPSDSTLSKYTILNGVIYLASGVLLIVWPGAVQTILFDAPFAGHERALMRVIGLTVVVIGWLYFCRRSGARQFAACTVIDRLIFVPLVLVPLVIAGVFPHLLGTLAILDPVLAIGTWVLRSRAERSREIAKNSHSARSRIASLNGRNPPRGREPSTEDI
jgi:hypothetical protein